MIAWPNPQKKYLDVCQYSQLAITVELDSLPNDIDGERRTKHHHEIADDAQCITEHKCDGSAKFFVDGVYAESCNYEADCDSNKDSRHGGVVDSVEIL